MSSVYQNEDLQYESLLDSLDYCTEYFEQLSDKESTPILEMCKQVLEDKIGCDVKEIKKTMELK